MKSNYTTKQFALYLRKLCEERSEDWHFTPTRGVEEVTDTYRLDELNTNGIGKWFFFNVHERSHDYSEKSECGVYVGPKRQIVMQCIRTGRHGFRKADNIFESRLRDCLEGQ